MTVRSYSTGAARIFSSRLGPHLHLGNNTLPFICMFTKLCIESLTGSWMR